MRKVIVVVMLAGALCADRVATAAPQVRPQVVEIARNMTRRLSINLRRVVPATRLHETRQEGIARIDATCVRVVPADYDHLALSPFQFRLPPPLC
jgi:hypothetical protein